MKIFQWIFIISILSHGAFSVVKYVEFENPIPKLSTAISMDEDQIEDLIVSQISDNNIEDAANTLAISKLMNHNLDYDFYQTKLAEMDTMINSLSRNSISFYDGFISGKSNSMYGVTGAVVSDFLVIGDIRTLKNELSLVESDRDNLNVTLASLGIVLTGTSIASAGTTGLGKFWVSFFKTAKKSKYMNSKFERSLVKNITRSIDFKKVMKGNFKSAINTKNMKILQTNLSYMQSVDKSVGSSFATLKVLKHANNMAEFKQLSKISNKYKHLTPMILKLSGRAMLKTAKVLKFTIKLILSLLECALGLIIAIVRIVK